MGHSYCNLLYHVVFSTKDLRPWLDVDLRDRLLGYIGGTIRKLGGVSIEMNAEAEHIHILAKLRQDKAVSDAIRAIKANSSGWMHDAFATHARFAWQEGYGAFTVSESQVGKVRRYIANQGPHHRKITFKEEFFGLLKVHGIEFDERFVLK